MGKMGTQIRFRNNGSKFITEYIGDNFISDKTPNGFIKGVAMFRIWNEQDSEQLGCISFTISLLVGLTRTGFPSTYKAEALVNLLHYLPFEFEKCIKVYPNCYEYRFDSGLDKDIENDSLYRIKADGKFEAIFQRLIFGGSVTNAKIQNAIKEILFNHWEDGTNTNVLFETLVEVLPVSEVNLIKNIRLLKDDGDIHTLLTPENPEKIVSLGLEPKAIRVLDGDIKEEVKYPLMVKNIYGTSIETTTHGANSPVVINVEKIETLFENIQKEIEANPKLNLEEKKETSQIVKGLELEISQNKDPKKIAVFAEKLQKTASWVWQKILSNPYVSGIIIELLSKATLG